MAQLILDLQVLLQVIVSQLRAVLDLGLLGLLDHMIRINMAQVRDQAKDRDRDRDRGPVGAVEVGYR
jgi:hypothetical protein